MKVTRLIIENFQGVDSATLHFDGHTLLVGMNNVGKSTVCEALDLVLGPDRLSKFPPIEEFDFYNSTYLEADGETPKPLRIEVVLTDLNLETSNSCGSHLEFWHKEQRRLLEEGDADLVDTPAVEPCLRLETIGKYDPEEDEFEAKTYFSHSPNELDGSLKPVSKNVKRMIGFLYLRTLRTGTRALSLERGSLLDIILRLGKIRTGLWEQAIKRLRALDPPIDQDAAYLRTVLDSIEKRLAQYIPAQGKDSATKLFVSQLTREHLRKTMAFFLSMAPDQEPVPFQEVGTGTLNTLVLALLSFIAEIKKDNVIFAMEEPEIALPPHTQRRVANYLLNKTTQCFVTSHSPYIIEQFEPQQIQILRRSEQAELTAAPVILGGALKPKTYRKHARRGLCEAMLGKAVIVTEGLTEQVMLRAVADKMEAANEDKYPLDLSGVTIFSSDGDGSLPAFGAFFKNLGLKTYAFYDQKQRKPQEIQALQDAFDLPNETAFTGAEELLIREIPVDRQWLLLEEIRNAGEQGNVGIPVQRPDDDDVRALMANLLKGRKGDGTAGRLIDLCEMAELPISVVNFLSQVYTDFPQPEPVPVPIPIPSVLTENSPVPEVVVDAETVQHLVFGVQT
ncbi:DNA replication and repair protein RecF [Pelotomaculum sp. FP]|uniref:ATP-dependent nuclease n=1 Tax=Pelotomaculum sp. FP TaxID=261474 RepID=UPI0010651106|nr:AAA family ATPase [Pelotomaculum sp. FP]TEB10486.1 DNA replication and repair protein RecF [Pelotomaculum sp. FP]